MVEFSVVVATLLRPSYTALIASLRQQTFHSRELITRTDPPNEYVGRNRGARQAVGEYLVFRDDDTILPTNHLAILAKGIQSRDPAPVAIGGPLRGNMWGSGAILLNEPKWGIGANMTIRRDAFEAVGGFEEDWGLGYPVKGWRADSLGADEPVIIRDSLGVRQVPVSSLFVGGSARGDGKEEVTLNGLNVASFDGVSASFFPASKIIRHRVTQACDVVVYGSGTTRMTPHHNLFMPQFKAAETTGRTSRRSDWRGLVWVNGGWARRGYGEYSDIRLERLVPVRPETAIGKLVVVASGIASDDDSTAHRGLPFPIEGLTIYDTPLNHYAIRFAEARDILRGKDPEFRRRYGRSWGVHIAREWMWAKHGAVPIRMLRDIGVDISSLTDVVVVSKGNHRTLEYRCPIPLDEEMLKFFGLWVADGSYFRHGVAISCAEAGPLVARIATRFGAGYRLGNNGVDWKIQCSFLRRVMELSGWRGESATKRVAPWVFSLPPPLRSAFLNGYWMGDGHLRSAVTINRRLAEDVRCLLLLGGRWGSITHDTCRTPFSNGNLQTFWRINELASGVSSKTMRFGPYTMGRVVSVSPVDRFDDYVYDIHVPGRGTFFTGNLLVHNTDLWWTLEDRYPGGLLWLDDLVVDHPGPMGSTFQPEVEDVFIRRWKSRVMERFLSVDPRLQQMLLQTQTLTPEERGKVIRARQEMRKSMPHIPVLPQEV